MARSLATAKKTSAPRQRKLPSAAVERDSRLEAFGRELEAIYREVEAQLGSEDAAYIRRLRNVSRMSEIAGRTLIHFSLDPFTFTGGVLALWVHKQLETTEIGHMALHGAYEKFCPEEELQAKSFRWKFPVDEASWRQGHNARHHAFTNVASKDPDIHFGFIRLTPETPHRWINYFQLPTTLFFILPNFGSAINTHVSGLLDVYLGNGLDGKFDFIEDRSWPSILEAHKKAFRKWIPYYAENYIFYPALAGPFFWKVWAGNYMADKMRDVFTGLTVFCGHVGDDVESYTSEKKPRSRGEWYAMQVEAANSFEVSRPVSILCGALNLQIEHHLFPKLPPNRLREISPAVRACCERHGVRYKSATWFKTAKKVFTRIAELSLDKTSSERTLEERKSG